MTRIKTFKGIRADQALCSFIESKHITTYIVTGYHNKVGTHNRFISIRYEKPTIMMPFKNK